MTNSVTCIRGFWRGTPTATLTSGDEPPLNIVATARDKDWGSSILIGGNEREAEVTPWVEVTIPSQPDRTHSSAACLIDFPIEYPKFDGKFLPSDSSQRLTRSFVVEESRMLTSAHINFAPRNAGRKYNNLWWEGTLGGVGLILVFGRLLHRAARSLQKTAPATRLYPATSD